MSPIYYLTPLAITALSALLWLGLSLMNTDATNVAERIWFVLRLSALVAVLTSVISASLWLLASHFGVTWWLAVPAALTIVSLVAWVILSLCNHEAYTIMLFGGSVVLAVFNLIVWGGTGMLFVLSRL